MGQNTAIQWTDHSWNPWQGCKKVSAGCQFCYMYRDKERYNQDPYTPIRSQPSTFNKPLSWKEPARVFACSWSDFFIKEADDWRNEAWAIIKNTPHLTYQILTKRPGNIRSRLPEDWGDSGYENVWLGVSIESHEQVDRLTELHFETKTYRSRFKTFVSAEPLIDFLTFSNDGIVNSFWFEHGLDWLIIGGESGNDTGKYRYRPCKLEWIESLIDEAKRCGVPVFVKQLGTYLAKELGLKDRHGGDWNEWPEHLRIREFPVGREVVS